MQSDKNINDSRKVDDCALPDQVDNPQDDGACLKVKHNAGLSYSWNSQAHCDSLLYLSEIM